MVDLGEVRTPRGAEPFGLSQPRAAALSRGRDAARSTAKRAFDVILASFLFVFLLPLLTVVAILVKLDSRGPVIFSQRRAGYRGETFRILKFRTMTVVEDGDTIRQATRGDDRVTRIGRVLRRMSLDELPQLVNVLRGEMSLIGPRPHALAHDEYYSALIPDYRDRFRVRPGVTGLAQVSGARGPTETPDKMRTRILYDNRYIDGWSMGLDIWILVKTVVGTPFHKSAH